MCEGHVVRKWFLKGLTKWIGSGGLGSPAPGPTPHVQKNSTCQLPLKQQERTVRAAQDSISHLPTFEHDDVGCPGSHKRE